ncbi:hypothetical protein ACJIZ3_014892 [Penstemon smallii]|uniref:Protein kinase domain-containing protein n=1 Tax=Penstemon smallii TaxID=265156 RepID=A0ABD3RKW6_9LAMI
MDWIRGEKLGHGSFATVSLAVPKKQSNQNPPLMAVKSCGVLHSSSLMREKLILDELKDCPEIIQCYGESFSYENGEKLYNVLLEYASGGALSEKLKNSDDHRLPELEIRRYTKSLLKGLNFIHKAGYVHCDIKLQNILITPNGLKIADFGLAKRAGIEKKEFCSPGCEMRGTPLYMSPETVTGGEQGPPADIWALGCSVAEMVTGTPAWRCADDVAELLMRIGVGDELPEIPSDLSEEGKDFIRCCFVKDPIKRWTAEMLLDHPFIYGYDDDDLSTVALEYNYIKQENREASPSPRCPFDFSTCFTTLPSSEYTQESFSWFSGDQISAAERLRSVASEKGPDWSVTEDWVTVR